MIIIEEIKLFEHQKKVLDVTKNMNRVAYYLDMGLGKTFVGSEKMRMLKSRVNLIVCQNSKVDDWIEHVNKYYYIDYITFNLRDKHKLQRFIDFAMRETKVKIIGVINYDLINLRDLSMLTDFTLMLDESSLIQNDTAKRTKAILSLKPKNVILLSGTPTGGKYERLWTQFKLLGWNISKNVYDKQFVVRKKKRVTKEQYISLVVGYKNVDRLNRKLREHGAVFMKTEEVFDLPDVVDNIIKVNCTKEYDVFKKNRVININGNTLIGDTILTKMLYERQLCGSYSNNKIAAIKDILESTDDRLIIFYNFKDELEVLKSIIDRPISEVNGSVKDLKAYNEFANSVTLIQYQSGAMGLNLQKANKIIYFTLPLSNELFEQSKKRTHRIGQDRTCFYYYPIVSGSIEEKIFDTLKKRKDYTEKLFEEVDV